MHMIKVVEQNETIPKVPRWFGSPIHLYGGLLGIVALVAEFAIYFVGQQPQLIQQSEERGVIHGDESEQPFICERVVCITYPVCRCHYDRGWILVIYQRPVLRARLFDLSPMAR